jgi:hypothetical protein
MTAYTEKNEEIFIDHLPGMSQVLSGSLSIPAVQSPALVNQ